MTMESIWIVMALPTIMAAAAPFIPSAEIRGKAVYAAAGILMAFTLFFLGAWLNQGGQTILLYVRTEAADHAMLAGEFLLMGLIVFLSVRHKKYPIALLSVVQTCLVAWVESRTEFTDRSGFFFSMLFFFLAAMFGLVLSANLIWMYFFWEITSVISFLLIGYTRTDEAVTNSFRALWMNLLGGLGFAVAIALSALDLGTVELDQVVAAGSLLPLACLSLAGLTKSAQLPLSSWLLGAMVAPTPSSALLHSATSLMAIAQNDGKKVLAFSTVSNLGLIVACAGIGMEETIWGAVLLMIFHSVSKSMLFQAVGATENCLGSRDIENMHGMLLRLPKLTYIMGIGIAGMYLAPFGMLISKWVALKAFVDSGNYILVLFLAYGSASTMFYWTKWLAKLISMHHTKEEVRDVTRADQYVSMFLHAGSMLCLCLLFPLLATRIVNPIILQIFGESHEVLSINVLNTMAVMLASVIVVPAAMFLVTKAAHRDYVPIYMGGVNEGDNTYFTNSYGLPEHLYLTNWYLRFEFGMRHLRRPSEIISAGVLVVLFCVIIGGAI